MEIAVEPYSRISVRSYLKFDSPAQMIETMTKGIGANVPASGTLRWANGILFQVNGFQPSDSITKEYIKGHLLWDHLDFAEMPTYVEEIRLPEKPYVSFAVVNLSEHTLFGPFCQWIKDNLAKKRLSALPHRHVEPRKS